jgi:hypothetical protein
VEAVEAVELPELLVVALVLDLILLLVEVAEALKVEAQWVAPVGLGGLRLSQVRSHQKVEMAVGAHYQLMVLVELGVHHILLVVVATLHLQVILEVLVEEEIDQATVGLVALGL